MKPTESLILPIGALGQEFTLLANYKSDDGFLFVIDIHDKPNMASDFSKMSNHDQKLIHDNFIVDPGLAKILDKKLPNHANVSSTEWSDKLKPLFHMVHINNAALFWNKINSKTYFFLDIFISLKQALKSKDGKFVLDYISFDLILKTGDESITDDDKKIYKKIADAKSEILGQGKLNHQINQVTDRVNNEANTINNLVSKINKQALETSDKIDNYHKNVIPLEALTKNILDQQKEIENRMHTIDDVLEIEKEREEKEKKIEDSTHCPNNDDCPKKPPYSPACPKSPNCPKAIENIFFNS